MQMLETLKSKGQTSFTNLVSAANEQPDDVKLWGVTAGSAVVGAVAVNAAARGVVAILAALGCATGGSGHWWVWWCLPGLALYARLQAAEQSDVSTFSDPVVETIAISGVEAQAASVTIKDDLQKINGIGPVYAGRLHAAGIHTFTQLAQLSPEQVRQIIGPLRSGHMIVPEAWIAEARQFVMAAS
ncbi:MAG: helix-hairpin-helix domain-containing protein [Caldilineaceae bacterium]